MTYIFKIETKPVFGIVYKYSIYENEISQFGFICSGLDKMPEVLAELDYWIKKSNDVNELDNKAILGIQPLLVFVSQKAEASTIERLRENMNDPIKSILKRNKHEEEILELIYSHEDYTTSDLQGRVSAIVINIINDYK